MKKQELKFQDSLHEPDVLCICKGKATDDTKIMIPDGPNASDSAWMKARKHELFKKRTGIKPVIGHCKSDHRLGQNFYNGRFGKAINVMVTATAFNLKRAMRLLLYLFRWAIMRMMTEGRCLVVTCKTDS